MKKSKSIVLIIAPVLSTLLFNACGGRSPDTTRDVYQNKEDCAKDWGEQELCEQMNDQDDTEYRRNGGMVTGVGRPIYGPQYYPNDRTVVYKGNTISPPGRSTSMPPYSVTSRSSASSRTSSISSPRSSSSSSTTYGGFGSRSSSSSSGS
jgi:uncharacterized protein YgiB involved in biofilm formation